MSVSTYLFKKEIRFGWPERLLLSAAVGLGISALVLLELFSTRIEKAVAKDTKSLLAADFQIQANRPFDDSVYKTVESIAGPENYSEQNDLFSSATLPNGEIESISLRGIRAPFPFYGKFRTEPSIDLAEFSESTDALVDESMKLEGLKIGSQLKIGNLNYTVSAFIQEEPQTVSSFASLGPRVIVPLKSLEKTGLTDFGARVFRMLLVKTPLSTDSFRKAFRAKVPEPHWRIISPERANNQAGRVVERLRSYLSLVALGALLLGGAGVFLMFRSLFFTRVAEFLSFRAMGMSRKEIMSFAFFQAALVLVLGVAMGFVTGLFLERAVADFSREFLGVATEAPPWGRALVLSLGVGALAVFSSLYGPLAGLLKLSPAQAFRDSVTPSEAISKKEVGVLLAGMLLLSLLVSQNIELSFAFLACVCLAALMIYFVGQVLERAFVILTKRASFIVKTSARKLLRQKGAAKLLLMTLGLSLFILLTLRQVSDILSSQIDFGKRLGIPNLIFINMREADVEAVKKLVPSLDATPITQARLLSLAGKPIEELQDDEVERRRFMETREYVITRRSELADGEKLVQGKSLFGPKNENLIRASLEVEFAQRMNLKVGDRFQISIAGVNLEARLDSFRKVDWLNFRPNFFIVIAREDLLEAPMDFVGVGTLPIADLPSMRKQISQLWPHISTLDGLTLAGRLKSILEKLSGAVLGVALFSLISSLFVLLGFLVSKAPLIREEKVLWRYLGLESERFERLQFSENVLLSLAAALAAVLSSVLSSWVLSYFILEIAFEMPSHQFWFMALGGFLFPPIISKLMSRF